MYIRCEKYEMFTNILHLRTWFFHRYYYQLFIINIVVHER